MTVSAVPLSSQSNFETDPVHSRTDPLGPFVAGRMRYAATKHMLEGVAAALEAAPRTKHEDDVLRAVMLGKAALEERSP